MSLPRPLDSRLVHVPSADWEWRQVVAALSPRVPVDAVARVEEAAQAVLGVRAVAFGSARTAIWAALRGVPGLRRVWIPAYTCVAVPNAVEAAGLEIRWADVDGPNIAISQVLAEAQAGDGVIAQHTYGVAPDADGLRAARAKGLYVLEDRAHAFDASGLVGQAAVFSLEHSKVVSGGQGGLLCSRHIAVLDAARAVRSELPRPPASMPRRVLLTSLTQLALDWDGDVTGRISSAIRRVLLRVPATSVKGQTADEYSGRGIEPTAMHPRLAAIAALGIARAHANLAHRTAIAAVYRERLAPLVPNWLPTDRPLVRFPVLVNDASATQRAVRQRGLDLGPRWFEAPVHPAGAISSYVSGSAPQAERLARRVLTLPTHPRIAAGEAARIADIVAAAAGLL